MEPGSLTKKLAAVGTAILLRRSDRSASSAAGTPSDGRIRAVRRMPAESSHDHRLHLLGDQRRLAHDRHEGRGDQESGRWLGLVEVEAELFAKSDGKLKAGDEPGAEYIVTKLSQNANKANVEVPRFGFRYCRLEPAKFT